MSIPEPTYTTVNGVKVLTFEGWYLNGQCHRTDGPAWRQWHVVDGRAVLACEVWYLNGQVYRTDGPAWRQWQVVGGQSVLTSEGWYLKAREIHPRILRQPVRAIERWWRFQQKRRQHGIEATLWREGMTVFPGFMDMMRKY